MQILFDFFLIGKKKPASFLYAEKSRPAGRLYNHKGDLYSRQAWRLFQKIRKYSRMIFN